METMRGVVVLGDRKVTVREFPKPVPGPDEVLIRTKLAAICGSDLHFYRDTPQNLGDRTTMVVGHEPTGIVEAIGDCVTNVQVGDRVTAYHHMGCGTCEHCLAGNIMLCDEDRGIGSAGRGANADYICLPANLCLPLPDELNFVHGAFIACIAATGYSALRKLSPSGRDTIAVSGLGPVGLVTGLMGKAFGAQIVGLDLMPERLELARQLGFDHVVDVSQDDSVATAKDLTGGRGVDGVVETSGNPTGQVNAVHMVRKRGKVVFVGAGQEEPCIAPWWFLQREVTLQGSFVMPISYYDDLVRFILRHEIDFEPLVTHRFTIDDAEEAFRLADSGTAGKILFVWD